MVRALRHSWPVLLLILLPVLPLWRAVLLGEAIGPWGQIGPMVHASSWMAPLTAWDVLQADGVLQFYVWRDLLFHGEGNPTWNPYQLTGTPLLGNSQSGVLYPPHQIVRLLGLGTALAITLLAWFHLAVAGLGARFLALRLGAAPEGAWLAGAGLILSPFLVSWTVIASVPTTVAWIPWALAFLVAQLQRPHPWHVAGAAAAVGMTLLGGHLQFAAFGLMACALVLTVGVVTGAPATRAVRTWAPAIGAIALGTALAAPQLLPVLENAQTSHRRGAPTAAGYQAYRASALTPVELAGFVFPNVTGLPGVASTRRVEGRTVPSYWPAFAKPGANYAEGALAISPALLALLLLMRRRPDDRAALWVVGSVGVFGLLIALGTPLAQALYFGLPGWSATGSPGRAAVLTVLALLLLVALAWPRPGDGPLPALRGWIAVAGVVVTFAATSWLVTLLGRGTGGRDGPLSPLVLATLSASHPGQVAAMALAGLATFLLVRRMAWPAALVAAACPLALGALQTVPTGPFIRPPALADPGERVAFVNLPWSLTAAAPAYMPPNVASLGRIHDLAGYDSILDRGTVDWLRQVNGRDPAPPANGNMMFVKPSADPVLLAESGVTRVFTRDELRGWPPPTATEGGLAYSIPGPGRASVDGRPVGIASETLDSVTVEATGPGRLTLRDRNLPGWRATVNGRTVPIAPGLWRVVELPPGPATVRFSYTPPGAATGGAIGLTALLAWLGLAGFGLRQRRTSGDPDRDKSSSDSVQ